MKILTAFLLLILASTPPAFASELDDTVDIGGFHPNMTLDDADRHAGGTGVRECKTWPPNPTIHWCKWTFSDAAQHVEITYGADGVIHDVDRRVPLPQAMSDAAALAQAAEKFAKYGPPARDIIPDNLHWGCKGHDCGAPRMIRVWVMDGLTQVFNGNRHIAIGWTNRLRSAKNQRRFEVESGAWQAAQNKQRLKL